ncbi:MAG: TfoX/Sxy family protein [Flavobacteriales bacterium]|nr:TfoX/Sxy family protein [Flavobacteriales bacterium]
MPHDPLFEQQIHDALVSEGARPEHKKMFGGVAFMVKGHMSVGITNKGDFMARFNPERHDEVLQWPGAKPMTFGHKNMKGFVFVDADAVGDKRSLGRWVKLSLAHIATLPSKSAKKPMKKTVKAPAKKTSRHASN